jgi:hypothetical protein
MFYSVVFMISALFFTLDAKENYVLKKIKNVEKFFWNFSNTEKITKIEDFNSIGLFDYSNIIQSDKKHYQIICLFKDLAENADLREEAVHGISIFNVLRFFSWKNEHASFEELKKAYYRFRDSLTDDQLSAFNKRINIYYAKFIGGCVSAYIALLLFAAYEQLQLQAQKQKQVNS